MRTWIPVAGLLIVAAARMGAQAPASRTVTIPAGTEWLVRLSAPMTSAAVKADQKFEAGLLRDQVTEKVVVVPAGAIVRGFVSSVRVPSRGNARGTINLSFEDVQMGEQAVQIRASVLEVLEPRMGGDDGRAAAIADAGGGVVSGPMGSGMRALVGVVVTPAGAISAAEGGDVKLPAGAVLRIRLDRPVPVALR
jgi:hypothetical protein